jgi:hypothetical protein
VSERSLVLHPSGEPLPAVQAVRASVRLDGSLLRFEYRLRGDLEGLALPARAQPLRADRLWEHTCFEAFVAAEAGGRYCELNFSPSLQWAAYEFTGYRQGMRPLALAASPSIGVAATARELVVTAAVERAPLGVAPWPWRVGLTAVVETRAGGIGFFALQHPREKPDFHDAAGFAVSLAGSAR